MNRPRLGCRLSLAPTLGRGHGTCCNGRAVACSIDITDAKTLHQAIAGTVEEGLTIHTDEHRSYHGRRSVKHSSGEYVGSGDISTNSIDSMWAVLERGIYRA